MFVFLFTLFALFDIKSGDDSRAFVFSKLNLLAFP